MAYLHSQQGEGHEVLIDPYRGTVLAERSGLDVKSFVRIFHKQFYLVTSTVGFHGTLIVGAFALVLCAACVTGLCAFPRWWAALFTLRVHRGGRTLASDLHRCLGTWSLLAGLLLALTGLWYWGEQILTTAGLADHDAWPSDALQVVPPDAEVQRLSWDTLIQRAEAAYPGLSIEMIQAPRQAADPFVVIGQAEAWAVRSDANVVALDPYSGAVLLRQRGVDLDPLTRLGLTMDPVHFGTFGGAVTRWWYLLSGLALSAGILLGALVHARRTLVTRERGAPVRRALWCWSGLAATAVLLVAALSSAGYISAAQLPDAGVEPGLPPPAVPLAVWLAIAIFAALVLIPSALWLALLRMPAGREQPVAGAALDRRPGADASDSPRRD